MYDLLKHAVGQTRISGLMGVLEEIARATDSFGCILWQVAKPYTLDPPEGHLFVLADWFPENLYCANHELSLGESKTGLGIRTGTQQNVTNVKEQIADPDRFLQDTAVTAFCTTPIEFMGGELGSVNLYRRNKRPYSKRDLDAAKELARAVPMLHSIIRDKVSFTLLTSVDSVAQWFDQPIPPPLDPIEHARSAMGEICKDISTAFHCLETTIFLEDRLSAPGQYAPVATTWPLDFDRRSYTRDETNGITGWSLAHPETPVRIFDLVSFNPDAPETPYPGMRWKDSLRTRDTVRKIIEVPEEEQLPPLSLMTAPILRSGAVIGLIRCSIARGPVYFADADHAILRMIAARLGSIWGSLLDRREMEEETKALETLVEKIGELNGRTYEEARKEKPEKKDRILEDALAVASSVIPSATINDVRLLTEDRKFLKFAVIHGEAWEQGKPEEVQRRKTREFPLDSESVSVGAHVIETGEVRVIQDVTKDPFYVKNFPNAKKMIVAPLMLGVAGQAPEMFGVLDFRSTANRDFPRYARYIAGLLGTQLALYLKLSSVVRELRRMRDVQIRVSEDMDHQFKTPILNAYTRVHEALKVVQDASKNAESVDLVVLEDKLLTARGVCAKAMHVSQNSRLFAQLAKDEPLEASKVKCTSRELVSTLINIGTDASLLYHGQRPAGGARGKRRAAPQQRPRRFIAHTEGLEKIESIQLDRDLFEQAVTQVLDNAFKYSYADTAVEITGGYINKETQVRISVINEGIPIERDEVDECIKRGWQGEIARQVSQAGSGIGLWIVDHIMRAMGGELRIIPTRNDRTEVMLILPVH